MDLGRFQNKRLNCVSLSRRLYMRFTRFVNVTVFAVKFQYRIGFATFRERKRWDNKAEIRAGTRVREQQF